MKEHPILFSGPMVRAILEGRKTQTRRVVRDTSSADTLIPDHGVKRHLRHIAEWWCGQRRHYHYPYGQKGDRLWVRETHGIFGVSPSGVHVGYRERLPDGKTLAQTDGGLDIIRVGEDETRWAYSHLDSERWRPSIFMPRWASRITLEITDVRVERLQEISGQDCVAEGMMLRRWLQEDRGEGQPFLDRGIDADGRELQLTFRNGWDALNAKRGYGWDKNPWVWVISFETKDIAA